MRVIVESADTPNQRKAADLLRSLGLAEVVVDKLQPSNANAHENANPKVNVWVSNEERMVRRVIDIFVKMATRNGKQVETNARGHGRSYQFNVNAAGVERAMNELLKSNRRNIADYLNGRQDSEAMTVVCPVVGYIIKSRMMNSSDMQLTDIGFALVPFYGKSTAVNYLSRRPRSCEANVLFGALDGLLKRYQKG